MATPSPFAVNPLEAIEFLRQKLNIPTEVFTDVWAEQHARGFMVAGARTEAVVSDFHNAMNIAARDGMTYETFLKDHFDRIVETHGWTYKGERRWRAKVIFETNIRQAWLAGKWLSFQRLKRVRPYVRYVALQDGKTRPQHMEWHNTVLHIDHPWWDTHWPLNGYGCRCDVESLSESDLKRYGYRLSPEAPVSVDVVRPVRAKGVTTYVKTPRGIDPGFAYNPGKAAFGREQQATALRSHGAWLPLVSPFATTVLSPLKPELPAVPLGQRLEPTDAEALRATLAQVLGGNESILTDAAGAAILLTDAIADHILEDPSRFDGREQFLTLIPQLITRPAEIWIGWAIDPATGKVFMRRRYILLLDIGKSRVLGLVADADGRMWSGMTFFRGTVTAANNLRQGLRIYQREPDNSEFP